MAWRKLEFRFVMSFYTLERRECSPKCNLLLVAVLSKPADIFCFVCLFVCFSIVVVGPVHYNGWKYEKRK